MFAFQWQDDNDFLLFYIFSTSLSSKLSIYNFYNHKWKGGWKPTLIYSFVCQTFGECHAWWERSYSPFLNWIPELPTSSGKPWISRDHFRPRWHFSSEVGLRKLHHPQGILLHTSLRNSGTETLWRNLYTWLWKASLGWDLEKWWDWWRRGTREEEQDDPNIWSL